jgi:hypothetical protein
VSDREAFWSLFSVLALLMGTLVFVALNAKP